MSNEKTENISSQTSKTSKEKSIETKVYSLGFFWINIKCSYCHAIYSLSPL